MVQLRCYLQLLELKLLGCTHVFTPDAHSSTRLQLVMDEEARCGALAWL